MGARCLRGSPILQRPTDVSRSSSIPARIAKRHIASISESGWRSRRFISSGSSMPEPGTKSRSLAALGMTKELAAIGRRFYDRGWVYGTSGNFSVVVRRKPLRLVVTASSVHKGTLRPTQFLEIDEHGQRVGKGTAKPSAETLLHTEIVKRRGAGAVLHTHSIWATILSGSADQAGVAIEG